MNNNVAPAEKIHEVYQNGFSHEAEGRERVFGIIYTSGSTGEPKGVMIPESSVLNRLIWSWTRFPFQEKEVAAVRTSLSFVDSICELLSPLLQGIRMAIVPKPVLVDPQALMQCMSEFSVSRILLIPSLLKAILVYIRTTDKQTWPHSLKLVTSSGEELTPSVAKLFFCCALGARLVNLYGSTEVMADVTCQEFRDVHDVDKYTCNGSLSIGSMINNTTAAVVNVDNDSVGELIISGASVTAGYHDKNSNKDCPESQKFFTHPQSGASFRTGDHVRIFRPKNGDEHGELVLIYSKRADSQVKIRGMRTDMSEVSRVMSSQFDVSPVLVFDKETEKILAFLPHDECQRIVNTDKMLLNLPRHAVPEVVNIGLQPFPTLESSGKIDKKQLLQLYRSRKALLQGSANNHWIQKDESLDPMTRKKMTILMQALEEAGIPYHPSSLLDLKVDNFFRIGGTSLNAILVVAKLKAAGFHVSVMDFMQSNSFEQLLDKLSGNESPTAFTPDPSFEEKYEFSAVTLREEDFVCQFMARNFERAERIYLSLHQNEPVLRKILHDDFLFFIHTIYVGSVKSGASFLVRQKSNGKLVGACLNIDESDVTPELYYEYKHFSWAVTAIVTLLCTIEKPVVERLKCTYKRILMAMLTCIDLEHVRSYVDRVSLMFEMEKRVIVLGRALGFQAVISTNTSKVTQDAADLLGYDLVNIVHLNQYQDPVTKGNPFQAAKKGDVTKTSVRLIERE